jgi:hypothetical protein
MAGLDVAGEWLVIDEYPTPAMADGQPGVYPPQFFTNSLSIAGASAVDLAHGEEKQKVDFRLEPATGVVGVLPRRYTLAARDDEWRAVQQSGCAAKRGAADSRACSNGEHHRTFLADRLGARSRVTRDPIRHRTRSLLGASDSDRRGVAISSLAVTLTRGVRISGRVVREDGGPLPPAITVPAEPADGDPALAGSSVGQIAAGSAKGEFAIDGVQPGEYLLRVTGGLIKSVCRRRRPYDRPIDVIAGTDITDVLIALTDAAATVAGTVRTGKGSPDRSGVVILFPVEREFWTRFGVTPRRIRLAAYFRQWRIQDGGGPGWDYYAIAVTASQRHAWHDSLPRHWRTG